MQVQAENWTLPSLNLRDETKKKFLGYKVSLWYLKKFYEDPKENTRESKS